MQSINYLNKIENLGQNISKTSFFPYTATKNGFLNIVINGAYDNSVVWFDVTDSTAGIKLQRGYNSGGGIGTTILIPIIKDHIYTQESASKVVTISVALYSAD